MYSLWLENSLITLSLIADVFTYHELIYSSSACQPSRHPEDMVELKGPDPAAEGGFSEKPVRGHTGALMQSNDP